MTQNQSINAALLAVGSLFIGSTPELFKTNFWYAAVAAIIGVVAFVTYELLP